MQRYGTATSLLHMYRAASPAQIFVRVLSPSIWHELAGTLPYSAQQGRLQYGHCAQDVSQSGGRQAAQRAKRRKLAKIDSDDEDEDEIIDLSSQPSPIPVRPPHLPFRCRHLTVAGASYIRGSLLGCRIVDGVGGSEVSVPVFCIKQDKTRQPPNTAHTATKHGPHSQGGCKGGNLPIADALQNSVSFACAGFTVSKAA